MQQLAELHCININSKKPLFASKSMAASFLFCSLERVTIWIFIIIVASYPTQVHAHNENGSRRSVLDPGLSGDLATLMAFKRHVEKDPNGKLSSWMASGSNAPCSFDGVQCIDSRVTVIDLSNSGLVCEFSYVFWLFGLEKIETLVLKSNAFYGNVSHAAGSNVACSDGLINVDLSGNKLQGPLANNLLGLCKKMEFLNMSRNGLSNPTDVSSFGLGSVKNLDVSDNGLIGDAILASVFSNCKSLESLDLANNKISGFTPELIQGCSALAYLDLSFNNILRMEFKDFMDFTVLNHMQTHFTHLPSACDF